MTHSVRQPASLTCSQCEQSFAADIWLIIDSSEQPDLLEQIRTNTLHDTPCPHCDHGGQLDAPLLLYQPGTETPLIFSPAQQTSPDQDREQAQGLLGMLHHSLGAAWQDEWLAQLATVPRPLLAAMMGGDPEAALRQMMAQAEEELDRLRQEDPAAYQELEAALSQLTTTSPPDTETPQPDTTATPPLLATIQQFIQADTWTASYHFVQAHPALLSDEAGALLDTLVQAAQAAGDDNAHRIFAEHRALLRRCQEIGITEAFAEKLDVPSETLTAQTEIDNLPPALREVLAELAQSGATINSPEDLERLLAQRPDLQAKLAAAAGQDSGSGVPPPFQTDLQQAQAGEQRYRQRGDRQGLDEAAAAWQRILDHPDFTVAPERFQVAALNDGGGVLLRRYWAQGQLADLNHALTLYQDAVARTPPDSPDRASRLNNLGTGLRDRWQHADTKKMQKAADAKEAADVYEKACRLGQMQQPEAAVMAARSWGRWALGRHAWAEAQRAYGYGLDALAALYRSQLLQQEQQSWQREGQGLYAQAAYARARSDDLPVALVLLEQGQARALNERLARDEADLQQVESEAPHLVEQYRAAASQLRRLETVERQNRSAAADPTLLPDWVAHRQQVATAREDLEAAIGAIRQLAGHEQFLQPPTWATIVAAVLPTQPLAYLATTPAGSLILLLHRSQASAVLETAEVSIEPLWADGFTETDLDNFLVKRAGEQVQGGYLPGQFVGGPMLQAALAEGLPRLGKSLLQPLAQRLAELGHHSVTLIPSGRLNLLPLHAVPISANGAAAVFGDAFTVSYAPSAGTLAATRRRLAANREQPDSLLAVGNPLPLPDGMRSLRYARPEAEEVALHFGDRAQLFCETAATHPAIKAAMPGCRYLHLACHGLFDVERPLRSGLILSGGERLTLRQVLDEIPLSGMRLAVLSACQTAISDYNDLPDEFIGLPAAFLQAGVAGVLGSLWPVDDLSTAIFMDHFYQLHRDKGQSPAEALQATQRWLRRLTVAELSSLFAQYKANAPDAPAGRMAYALAQEKFIDFTLAENQAKTPYADPYHWAAFAFYGV